MSFCLVKADASSTLPGPCIVSSSQLVFSVGLSDNLPLLSSGLLLLPSEVTGSPLDPSVSYFSLSINLFYISVLHSFYLKALTTRAPFTIL